MARESLASWLGINRATLAVLAAISGLGLAEELWRPFLALHLMDAAGTVFSFSGEEEAVGKAALYMGVFACLVNFSEGFGYILGGTIAHKLGPRIALLISALPMAAGFTLMFVMQAPWAIVVGALLLSNWEPLSVPAAFDVVGSEVPADRRTIAFAVQSIQKRVPKVIGVIFILLGAWSIRFALVAEVL